MIARRMMDSATTNKFPTKKKEFFLYTRTRWVSNFSGWTGKTDDKFGGAGSLYFTFPFFYDSPNELVVWSIRGRELYTYHYFPCHCRTIYFISLPSPFQCKGKGERERKKEWIIERIEFKNVELRWQVRRVLCALEKFTNGDVLSYKFSFSFTNNAHSHTDAHASTHARSLSPPQTK